MKNDNIKKNPPQLYYNSEPGNDGNEMVLCILQSFSITVVKCHIQDSRW